MTDIADRLNSIRARIERAAISAGRSPDSVRLVAVSKTKPLGMIREAYAAGQRDFGENYVQELLSKHVELGDLNDIVWHAIGHVQTNKAKDVVRAARVVHGIDSAKLAIELGRRAESTSATLDAFVQVNVGGEEQKSGCAPSALREVLEAVRSQRSMRLRGLMTVPPHTVDPKDARPYFELLASLREQHGGVALLPDLSMGMTHDLEVAIACGATYVRVGSAIFGDRGAV